MAFRYLEENKSKSKSQMNIIFVYQNMAPYLRQNDSEKTGFIFIADLMILGHEPKIEIRRNTLYIM